MDRAHWSALGGVDPARLVEARRLAHRAAQWLARAARANLDPLPDDSHTSLAWQPESRALLTQPIASKAGPFQVALRLADLELSVLLDRRPLASIALGGANDAQVGQKLDRVLGERGLRSVSGVKLPYALEGGAEAYELAAHRPALAELSLWFDAAASTLQQFSQELSSIRPGPGPVQCWPHHFDIATLVLLDEEPSESARSIGTGFSPGDDYYPQPYLYLSPWPRPADLQPAGLPALAPLGHWHTEGFFAAVATAEEILSRPDPDAGVPRFIRRAFDECRALLQA